MKDKSTQGNGLPHMLTDKWHGVRDCVTNSNQQNRCNSHQQNTDIFHKSRYGNSHVVTGKPQISMKGVQFLEKIRNAFFKYKLAGWETQPLAQELTTISERVELTWVFLIPLQ